MVKGGTAMIALKGVIHKGQVVLPMPVELPDGTEVTVLSNAPTKTLGLSEEDWPTDPEGIARLAARMSRAEPFETSAEEEADLAAWRRKVTEYTAAKQAKAVEELFE